MAHRAATRRPDGRHALTRRRRKYYHGWLFCHPKDSSISSWTWQELARPILLQLNLPAFGVSDRLLACGFCATVAGSCNCPLKCPFLKYDTLMSVLLTDILWRDYWIESSFWKAETVFLNSELRMVPRAYLGSTLMTFSGIRNVLNSTEKCDTILQEKTDDFLVPSKMSTAWESPLTSPTMWKSPIVEPQLSCNELWICM